MSTSDYNPIRVETPGNLFGLEPTQPGQERKRGGKNPDRRHRRVHDQADETDAPTQGADDPTTDQEDPHTVDYRA
jgi:hypothetical protein